MISEFMMILYSRFFRALSIKYFFPAAFLLIFTANSYSQKSIADSLHVLLEKETTDTGTVKLMWNIAKAVSIYDPDSALQIAQQALYMARQNKDLEGESRSLGILANIFMKIGNYPRALELNIQKLKLEEKRNNPRNLGSVLMNIGIVYVYEEEYRKALEYYAKADSVINKFEVKDLQYNIVLNLGDVYNRLNISDSALIYFNKSLGMARTLEDVSWIGKAMTGLGHSYRKLGSYEQSLMNYQTAIAYLQTANDDETWCEASLGLAKLYQLMNKPKSAVLYANQSLRVAQKDGLLPLELEAAEFMAAHYKENRNIDSAFAYLNIAHDLNDSINSKSRVRQLQVISSDEQFRQIELNESRRIAREERSQQLQMLLIGIFIPGFFMLTLLFSRVRLHVKAIRILGILSLLFFFEYLTLLLHPTVANLTHHTPVYEILIFVGIAAILIPTHHRLEHWLIHKLIHHRLDETGKEKRLNIKKAETKTTH